MQIRQGWLSLGLWVHRHGEVRIRQAHLALPFYLHQTVSSDLLGPPVCHLQLQVLILHSTQVESGPHSEFPLVVQVSTHRAQVTNQWWWVLVGVLCSNSRPFRLKSTTTTWSLFSFRTWRYLMRLFKHPLELGLVLLEEIKRRSIDLNLRITDRNCSHNLALLSLETKTRPIKEPSLTFSSDSLEIRLLRGWLRECKVSFSTVTEMGRVVVDWPSRSVSTIH